MKYKMKSDPKLLREFCKYLNVHCEDWWRVIQKRIHVYLSEANYHLAWGYLNEQITYITEEFNYLYTDHYNGHYNKFKSHPGKISRSDISTIVTKLWKELFNNGKIKTHED